MSETMQAFLIGGVAGAISVIAVVYFWIRGEGGGFGDRLDEIEDGLEDLGTEVSFVAKQVTSLEDQTDDDRDTFYELRDATALLEKSTQAHADTVNSGLASLNRRIRDVEEVVTAPDDSRQQVAKIADLARAAFARNRELGLGLTAHREKTAQAMVRIDRRVTDLRQETVDSVTKLINSLPEAVMAETRGLKDVIVQTLRDEKLVSPPYDQYPFDKNHMLGMVDELAAIRAQLATHVANEGGGLKAREERAAEVTDAAFKEIDQKFARFGDVIRDAQQEIKTQQQEIKDLEAWISQIEEVIKGLQLPGG